MPAESVLFVGFVVVLFAAFIVALAWGERQTRDIQVKHASPARQTK